MFELYETGLFLKNNYQLHVQYDTEPDGKQKEFIRRISEWNADPERFTPAKVCGIFDVMNNSGAEQKGTLGKKECCFCTGIEARYEEGNRIRYRLKGVPEMIAERISLISGTCAFVLFKGKKYYVFIEKKDADAWKNLKTREVSPADWPKECRNFLRKQVYSREVLAESFMKQNIPLYVIRPGFREAGEVIEPYYFGVSLNGSMDNFFISAEEYMRLYREHYKEDVVMLDGRICMMEFDSNLKYQEKLYQKQSIPNSAGTMKILRDNLKYTIGEECRWTKHIYCGLKNRDAMSVVRENTERTESVLIVTDMSDMGKWRKYFPDAWVCSPQTWDDDLDNAEEKTGNKPIVFVWAAQRGFDCERGYRLLQLLLRFLPVSRELIFLTEISGSDMESEAEKMEEVFYVSGILESIREEERRESLFQIPWAGETVLRCTEEKKPDELLLHHIFTHGHIFWVMTHLELYEMPQEWEKECYKVRQAGEEGKLSYEDEENWYHDFVRQYRNNLFMYINGVHPDEGIHSSILDAYFLPVGETVIPLGFLKFLYPDWTVSQRRRIYQWLFDEEEEWNTYLNENYIEFYAEGGETERRISDGIRASQLNALGALAADENSSGRLKIGDGMYTRLNEAEDIL